MGAKCNNVIFMSYLKNIFSFDLFSFFFSDEFGSWEKHTKGIGQKLLLQVCEISIILLLLYYAVGSNCVIIDHEDFYE